MKRLTNMKVSNGEAQKITKKSNEVKRKNKIPFTSQKSKTTFEISHKKKEQ